MCLTIFCFISISIRGFKRLFYCLEKNNTPINEVEKHKDGQHRNSRHQNYRGQIPKFPFLGDAPEIVHHTGGVFQGPNFHDGGCQSSLVKSNVNDGVENNDEEYYSNAEQQPNVYKLEVRSSREGPRCLDGQKTKIKQMKYIIYK